jgi:hypothetical protein
LHRRHRDTEIGAGLSRRAVWQGGYMNNADNADTADIADIAGI